MPCSSPAIKHWQTLNPPFPMPTIAGANRQAYSRAACFKWIEDNIISKREAGKTDMRIEQQAYLAECNLKIHKEESARIELEKLKGSVMDKREARGAIVAYALQYKAIVRSKREKYNTADRVAILMAAGATPEVVAIFRDKDLLLEQETTDLIDKECEKAHKA